MKKALEILGVVLLLLIVLNVVALVWFPYWVTIQTLITLLILTGVAVFIDKKILK